MDLYREAAPLLLGVAELAGLRELRREGRTTILILILNIVVGRGFPRVVRPLADGLPPAYLRE